MKKTRYFTENWALVEEDGKVYMAEAMIRSMFGKVQFEFKPISKRYDEIGDFDKNGIAIVKLDGLYGLVNEKGEEICKPQYEGIRPIFSKYFHAYNVGIRSHILNEYGQIVCEYKNLYDPADCEVAMIGLGDKWGIINSECREIHKREYDELKFFTDEYLKAKIGNLLILINLKGEEVLEINNGEIYRIEDGYFGVEADGKFGRLNSKGEVIIPAKYIGICKIQDGIFDAIIEYDGHDFSHRKIQQFDKNGRKIGKEFWKNIKK
ncbi:MAG: hypothetical protein E7314_05360 [Clostridiales bacterium]|nr:hypothetical protein [Clostridiales bacterium]